MQNITLYDLMAEDLDVYVTKNDKFGYDIQIDDEDKRPLFYAAGVHPHAANSFADFCRRYVAFIDKANGEIA